MPTKLCIFDLDGTLLDTIDDIANSMNRVLAANHYPEHDVAWYKSMVGGGARNLLIDALPPAQGLQAEEFDRLLRHYREDYRIHSMELTRPYDGIPELLNRLAELTVQPAIISNKPETVVREVVKRYFSGIEFAAVYGETEGKPIKPDPYLAREILARTGVSAEQAVFVGDSEVDMIFAERASLFSIGVLWGFRGREILLKHGAKAIVETPEQILGCLSV